MSKKSDQFVQNAVSVAGKVQQNKYLLAISNGLMATLPALIVGSIALLLASLPVKPWISFLTSLNLIPYLTTAYSVTVGCLAIYAAFLIGYQLAKNFDVDPIPAGILSLFSLLVLTPLITVNKATTLDMSKLGAQGLFTAMISSLIFVRLYVWLIQKKVGIKMPAGVPPFVQKTFAGLIPVSIVSIIVILISWLFGMTSWGSFSGFVYTILATPLQSLSSSIWSLLILVLFQMVLWFFGVHGSLVISSFITALYLPMDVANMDAVKNGIANAHLPNILGYTFYNLFAGIGGAGGTMSLIIVLLIVAKAKQLKTIASLSSVPGIFTINEPIIFGLPLILNPIMLVPFILTPVTQILIGYFGIVSGIFPRLNGIQVPFGTPIIVNGFIAGGWKIAILQIICVLAGCLIYYPFVKVLDKKALSDETTANAKA